MDQVVGARLAGIGGDVVALAVADALRQDRTLVQHRLGVWHVSGMGMVFTVLAFVIAGAIIFLLPWFQRGMGSAAGAGVAVGGAVGKLIDRLTIGHLTDFVSVGTFPVFNVADSSITVGVGVLLLSMYLQERAAQKQAASQVEQEDPANTAVQGDASIEQ